MPDIDLGALTIPIFCSIFGAGWLACFTILVRPLKDRVSLLETEVAENNAAKDLRIAALERKLGIGLVD